MATQKMKERFKQTSRMVQAAIFLLADAGVPDAIELVERRSGKNNLQAHAAHLTPLAVMLLLRHGSLIGVLARGTRLREALSGRERIWSQLRHPVVRFIGTSGRERVSQTIRTRKPLTISEVAQTYLPLAWGGSHGTGGAGASTLKRALKLAAHALVTFDS